MFQSTLQIVQIDEPFEVQARLQDGEDALMMLMLLPAVVVVAQRVHVRPGDAVPRVVAIGRGRAGRSRPVGVHHHRHAQVVRLELLMARLLVLERLAAVPAVRRRRVLLLAGSSRLAAVDGQVQGGVARGHEEVGAGAVVAVVLVPSAASAEELLHLVHGGGRHGFRAELQVDHGGGWIASVGRGGELVASGQLLKVEIRVAEAAEQVRNAAGLMRVMVMVVAVVETIPLMVPAKVLLHGGQDGHLFDDGHAGLFQLPVAAALLLAGRAHAVDARLVPDPVGLLGEAQAQPLLLEEAVVQGALEGGIQPPEPAFARLLFGAGDLDETFVEGQVVPDGILEGRG